MRHLRIVEVLCVLVISAIIAVATYDMVSPRRVHAAGSWATVCEWRAIPPFRTRGVQDIEAKIVRVDGREYVVFRSGGDIQVIER